MPHPAGLPDFFLDRSLGRIQVPRLLRAEGLRLRTLAEHYGIPQDETVSDTTWLAEAGQRGWAVLMKDGRIRYNAPETAAVHHYAVRCFCLTRQDLTAREMAGRFLHNVEAMAVACRVPGPFIYAVHESRLELLSLPDAEEDAT